MRASEVQNGWVMLVTGGFSGYAVGMRNNGRRGGGGYQ